MAYARNLSMRQFLRISLRQHEQLLGSALDSNGVAVNHPIAALQNSFGAPGMQPLALAVSERHVQAIIRSNFQTVAIVRGGWLSKSKFSDHDRARKLGYLRAVTELLEGAPL